MRRSGLTAAVFLAMALAAAAASAEDLTIDVAVDAVGLSPDVRAAEVQCQVCTADCETASSKQIVGQGSALQSFAPGGRPTFQGSLSVPVHTAKANATDYMCTLHVVNAAHESVLAGTGDAWTLPAPDTTFVPMLKGKLPASKAPVATRCANGGEPINGKCPNAGNVASTPPPGKCPDGRAMPANGNCGFVGPAVDLGGIFKLLTPPPGQPAPVANAPATKLTVQPCKNGKPHLADGSCPVTVPLNLNLGKFFAIPPPVEAPR
ncbi:MAG: hypothetical protein WDM94_13765 [Bauldia sp.]